MKKNRINIVLTCALIAFAVSIAVIILVLSLAGKSGGSGVKGVELRIEWSAVQNSGETEASVNAKLYLNYTALNIDAVTGNTLTINGDSITFDIPALALESNETKSILLATHTVKIPRKPGESVSCAISASWNYTGLIDGKQSDGLTAFKTAELTDISVGYSAETDNTETTASEVTTAPVTSPEPPPTTEPSTEPVTEAPPENFSRTYTLSSETGTGLDLRAQISAVEVEGTGVIKVKALLYLDYYSLYMSERSGCKFTVGDVSTTFTVYAVEESSNIKHSMYLATVELDASYGDVLNVRTNVPFYGIYNEIPLNSIDINGSIELK